MHLYDIHGKYVYTTRGKNMCNIDICMVSCINMGKSKTTIIGW